jgi:hypothetical protein
MAKTGKKELKSPFLGAKVPLAMNTGASSYKKYGGLAL